MRPPERGATKTGKSRAWVLCVVVAALVVSACSRLTFVRPDLGRGSFHRTAPELDLQTDARAPDARTALLVGQAALGRGDLAAARSAVDRALKLDRHSPSAHTLAAAVAEHEGQARKAGEHYRKAVELAPTRGVFLNNYGAWLCASGQPAEALPWFDQALADPGYGTPAAALANAGACALQAGDDQRAGPYLEGALALDPANPVALRAMATHEFRGGRYLRARAFSQRGLDAGGADPAALMLASQIEEKLGDNAAAARYVQLLETEFPGFAEPGTGENGKR